MTIFLVSTVQMVAFMGRISITAFYVIYCLGAFTLIALIMTIPSIGGVIGSLVVAPLANKIGKKQVILWILWDKSDKDFDDIRERLRNKHE